MADKPEAENTDHSLEELITGIGKLVYKLNESVVNMDSGIREFREDISTIMNDKMEELRLELVKANEGLDRISETKAAAPEPTGETTGEAGDEAASPEPTHDPSRVVEKLEEIKTEISGVGESLRSAETNLIKTMEENMSEAVDPELFKETMDTLKKSIEDSSRSMEDSMKESLKISDSQREKLLEKNVEVLSSGMDRITQDLDESEKKVEEKLEEIRTETAEEVRKIDESVKETARDQKEYLEKMRELLTLHSAEVKDDRVRDLNRRAIVHFNNAEYDQAMTTITEALEISPEDPRLLANLAHIEASLGEVDKAEDSFRRALEADPELEPAISGLGTLLVMSGRSDDTIEFLEKYLEDGSRASVDTMIALSRAYAAGDEHEKALELLEKAEKTAPGHPELEQEIARYRD